jgi:hypothetical protein
MVCRGAAVHRQAGVAGGHRRVCGGATGADFSDPALGDLSPIAWSTVKLGAPPRLPNLAVVAYLSSAASWMRRLVVGAQSSNRSQAPAGRSFPSEQPIPPSLACPSFGTRGTRLRAYGQAGCLQNQSCKVLTASAK